MGRSKPPTPAAEGGLGPLRGALKAEGVPASLRCPVLLGGGVSWLAVAHG